MRHGTQACSSRCRRGEHTLAAELAGKRRAVAATLAALVSVRSLIEVKAGVARRVLKDEERRVRVLASGAEVWKPTVVELEEAKEKKLPDLIAQGLRVLFCGINPGLYSAATGHHFARPGNRFWPTLHASGFTPRLIHPFEDRELLTLGLGITNLAPRTTASADLLSDEELMAGAKALVRKVARYKPKVLAMVGLTAYRTAFGERKATVGLQARTLGATELWLLPNPSGLNAHHQPASLARSFGELRAYVDVRS